MAYDVAESGHYIKFNCVDCHETIESFYAGPDHEISRFMPPFKASVLIAHSKNCPQRPLTSKELAALPKDRPGGPFQI